MKMGALVGSTLAVFPQPNKVAALKVDGLTDMSNSRKNAAYKAQIVCCTKGKCQISKLSNYTVNHCQGMSSQFGVVTFA